MPTHSPSITKTALGSGLLGALALMLLTFSGVPSAAAAGDVQLAGVDCAASPEVVEIKNLGTDGQDLTGWELLSDPSETFDLTPVGTIPAGGSVFIESGSGAQATFTWSQSQIFRDNDPTDYVRLVDNTGATKSEILCAQPTAAPTATPAPTPTPTPGPGLIPNGGGPPGAPDGLLSPIALVYAGVSVIVVTLGLGLSWMGIGLGLEGRRKRRSAAQDAPEAAAPAAAPDPKPDVAKAAPRAAGRASQAASAQPLLLALVVALAAAVLVAFLMQSSETPKRR